MIFIQALKCYSFPILLKGATVHAVFCVSQQQQVHELELVSFEYLDEIPKNIEFKFIAEYELVVDLTACVILCDF